MSVPSQMTAMKWAVTPAKVVQFKERGGKMSLEKTLTQAGYQAINWNEIEDMIDKLTWEKLTEQFWLDTRIPLSNDLDDWRTLTAAEKDMLAKVFGGLTLLDTLQSEDAIERLRLSTRTQHEEGF